MKLPHEDIALIRRFASEGMSVQRIREDDDSMWAEESVFYQIYPLGFCGSPFANDGVLCSRIHKVTQWIDHMKKLHVNALYLSPLFESDTHGYNTRDYRKVDCRLGTNEDFAQVCRSLHENGIRVVLDGVFNHVGRGFWAFEDVRAHREASPYRDWFYLDFSRDSNEHDGFWYEGWEGHYDLVKLNLENPAVVSYLFDCIREWVEQYDIDGLRLDVAYCLPPSFLKLLHAFCRQLKPDFFLVGELLHGDYNRWVNKEMLDSATNYECYKGLYSSFNSHNLFEIMHSLKRQFGPEEWTLYKGKHLLNFVDNHDVSRIASILQDSRHLPLIYALLFTMPGIPCIYYGSEWNATGRKEDGDPALRVCFDQPCWNVLCDWIARLSAVHQQQPALWKGDFHDVMITNEQCAFERSLGEERIWTIINAADRPYTFHAPGGERGHDLINDQPIDLTELQMPPLSAYIVAIR